MKLQLLILAICMVGVFGTNKFLLGDDEVICNENNICCMGEEELEVCKDCGANDALASEWTAPGSDDWNFGDDHCVPLPESTNTNEEGPVEEEFCTKVFDAVVVCCTTIGDSTFCCGDFTGDGVTAVDGGECFDCTNASLDDDFNFDDMCTNLAECTEEQEAEEFEFCKSTDEDEEEEDMMYQEDLPEEEQEEDQEMCFMSENDGEVCCDMIFDEEDELEALYCYNKQDGPAEAFDCLGGINEDEFPGFASDLCVELEMMYTQGVLFRQEHQVIEACNPDNPTECLPMLCDNTGICCIDFDGNGNVDEGECADCSANMSDEGLFDQDNFDMEACEEQ